MTDQKKMEETAMEISEFAPLEDSEVQGIVGGVGSPPLPGTPIEDPNPNG